MINLSCSTNAQEKRIDGGLILYFSMYVIHNNSRLLTRFFMFTCLAFSCSLVNNPNTFINFMVRVEHILAILPLLFFLFCSWHGWFGSTKWLENPFLYPLRKAATTDFLEPTGATLENSASQYINFYHKTSSQQVYFYFFTHYLRTLNL